MSNSKDVGDETEATIISAAIGAGYSVAIPFGDNDKYDLVLDDGDELLRIQCKTAWENKSQTIRLIPIHRPQDRVRTTKRRIRRR